MFEEVSGKVMMFPRQPFWNGMGWEYFLLLSFRAMEEGYMSSFYLSLVLCGVDRDVRCLIGDLVLFSFFSKERMYASTIVACSRQQRPCPCDFFQTRHLVLFKARNSLRGRGISFLL